MGNFRCLSCGKECADYQELALHISSEKKGHRRGKKWAAQYLHRHVLNKREHFEGGRVGLTEEQKEAKQDCMMTLSGQTKVVKCQCPKCRQGRFERLPIEHADNPLAWNVNGCFQIMCLSCGG